MKKTDLFKNALDLKHKVLLEEYKLGITFILGLISGVTLTTIYNNPTWYYYSIGSIIVSSVLWTQFVEPKKSELSQIQHEIRELAG